MHNDDPAWTKLLDWLQSIDHQIQDRLLVCSKRIPGAGRGLFTTTDVPPDTPLLTVLESAHINMKTLSPLYGSSMVSQLTATQLISMHLFLHRPDPTDKNSTDPKFGPYISMLPENFDDHPLSWLINSSDGDSEGTGFLVDCLPPAARRAVNNIANRFWEDWKVIANFLHTHHQILASSRLTIDCLSTTSKEYTQFYLWAWLNVNTRSIYYRITPSASQPDNITLCPLLDLANHRSGNTSPKYPIPTLFSPPSHTLYKGDEVFLTYGPHSNLKLFAEYGFVDKHSSSGGQADVEEIVESLFSEKGTLGSWMKNTLKSSNYWGDWTLHDAPPPPHPSYRLLPALRLLQLSASASWGVEQEDLAPEFPELHLWHDTILGKRYIVSPENEQAVRQQLLHICDITVTRAEEGLARLQRASQGKSLQGWLGYAVDAIKSLWVEERTVATALLQSIKNGGAID